ncbi:MAG: cytochrome c [Syntrophotaleaceae bacterium]
MLPAIQENILLLKGFQAATQILLSLLLCYLMGEAFFRLPVAFRARPNSTKKTPATLNNHGPRILSGWRTGLFLVLCLSFNLLALKIAYRATVLYSSFWVTLTLAFSIGLVLLLWARQYTFEQDFITGFFFLLGLEGEVLLFGVVFLLLNAESLLLIPEAWPFIPARPALFASWHGLVRFLEFGLLALLMATAGRLRAGAGYFPHRAHPLILVAVLLLPFCLFLELALIPGLAFSASHFILGGLFLASTAAAAVLLSTACFGSNKNVGTPLIVTLCLLITFWVLNNSVARERALEPVVLAGLARTEALALGGEREKAPVPEMEPAAPSPGIQEGEALFSQKCTVCHRYDQRLVGPPLNAVLPKYRNQSENLQAYLKDPVKIDPDYPAMPDLNLTDQETAALAEFLLSKIENPEQGTDNP